MNIKINFKISLGINGVLFHPKFFTNIFYEKFNKYSPKADDLWFSIIRIYEGIPYMCSSSLKVIKKKYKKALFKYNSSESNTDKIKKIFNFLQTKDFDINFLFK